MCGFVLVGIRDGRKAGWKKGKEKCSTELFFFPFVGTLVYFF